jgi:transposase
VTARKPGSKGRPPEWSDEENSLILCTWFSDDELAEILSWRTVQAIQVQRSKLKRAARELGLSVEPQRRRTARGHEQWSALEEAILDGAPSEMTNQELAGLLGRTLEAVKRKRSRVKPTREAQGPPWTPEEDEIVRRPISVRAAAKLLPGRSASTVQRRRKYLEQEGTDGGE